MKVHYPKLYNMAHLLALNVLLLPKDPTIIFIINLVGWDRTFLSVVWPTGVQLVFCFAPDFQ